MKTTTPPATSSPVQTSNPNLTCDQLLKLLSQWTRNDVIMALRYLLKLNGNLSPEDYLLSKLVVLWASIQTLSGEPQDSSPSST